MKINLPKNVLEYFSKIDGYISTNDADILYVIAQLSEPYGDIVEIGSLLGKSACVLASATNKNVYCIDTWESSTVKELAEYISKRDNTPLKDGYEMFLENTESFPNIKPIKGFSKDVFNFPNYDIGMVFIDGDHEKEAVILDAKMALEHNPKFICFHDFNSVEWSGTTEAALEVMKRLTDIVRGNVGVYIL